MDTRLKSETDYTPVLIIGDAGCGKSTMINYLLGRTMTPIKLKGVNKVDVTDGPSAPTICHDLTNIGTTRFDRFDNKIEKISYYDTPPFTSEELKDQASIEKELIEKAELVKEKNGVIIFVYSVVSVNIHTLNDLKKLFLYAVERIDAINCNILFVATNKIFGDEDEYKFVEEPKDDKESPPNTIECYFGDTYLRIAVIGANGESTATRISKTDLPHDFPNDFETLMKDPKKNLSTILERRKKILIKRDDGKTSSYLSHHVADVCKTVPSLQFLLEKIRNPDNWILMNLFKDTSRNDLHLWIKTHATREESHLSSTASTICRLTAQSTPPVATQTADPAVLTKESMQPQVPVENIQPADEAHQTHQEETLVRERASPR